MHASVGVGETPGGWRSVGRWNAISPYRSTPSTPTDASPALLHALLYTTATATLHPHRREPNDATGAVDPPPAPLQQRCQSSPLRHFNCERTSQIPSLQRLGTRFW